jgi:ubiquinone/menaquinone biosynthesis C-methylase UbiE
VALIDKDHQAEYWANNPNARRYDHPVVRAFARQRLDWLDGIVPLKNVERALDVGCGDGFATYYMDERVKYVEAGDASELMLKIHPLPAERLHLLDAENMHQFADKSYDLVYAWEVLHHLTSAKKAVAEMVRVSKKHVVIFEPNRDHALQFLFGLAVKHERGILRSTKEYLTSLTEGLPVRIKALSYSGRIPPNKTPESWLPLLLSMPFEGGRYDAISVGMVLERTDV